MVLRARQMLGDLVLAFKPSQRHPGDEGYGHERRTVRTGEVEFPSAHGLRIGGESFGELALLQSSRAAGLADAVTKRPLGHPACNIERVSSGRHMDIMSVVGQLSRRGTVMSGGGG